MAAVQKPFSKEEIEYIIKHYGRKTTTEIGKKLGRTRASIKMKIIRLNLGTFNDNSDELHLVDAARLVHRDHSALSRNWAKRGLKIRKVGQFRMIKEKDLAKFMYENQDLWDATETETYFFEYYDWFHEKLLNDRIKKDRKYEAELAAL